MKNSAPNFFLAYTLLLSASCAFGQPINESNQALIIIIGNPLSSDNINDFINTNPYSTDKEPPARNTFIIEPTIENGVHMRFEVEASQFGEPIGSASFSQSGSDSWKTRKSTFSLSQLSFNFKKKFRACLPKRKKKYKPHLCGRF